MMDRHAEMPGARDKASRKCTVAVDAQAQSMCSLPNEHMAPGLAGACRNQGLGSCLAARAHNTGALALWQRCVVCGQSPCANVLSARPRGVPSLRERWSVTKPMGVPA